MLLTSGKHSPGRAFRQVARKGLFHTFEVRTSAGRGWFGRRRWLRCRWWWLDALFLGRELNTAAILARVDRQYGPNWNDDRLTFSAKARKKTDGLIPELKLMNRLRMDIEHDLAILDEGLRYLHTGHHDIDHDLRRKAAIEGPFVQRADQVRSGGTIG